MTLIKFKDIFKLAKPYVLQLRLFLGFNILAAIFNVVSIIMLVPFLRIILGKNEAPSAPVALSGNPGTWVDFLSFKLSDLIASLDPHDALLICVLGIIISFFLKNIFVFLTNYHQAYVRSAVVRDIRKNLYSHILSLPLSYFGKEKRGDILSRFSNDVKEVEWSLLGVMELYFKHPIAIVIPLAALSKCAELVSFLFDQFHLLLFVFFLSSY